MRSVIRADVVSHLGLVSNAVTLGRDMVFMTNDLIAAGHCRVSARGPEDDDRAAWPGINGRLVRHWRMMRGAASLEARQSLRIKVDDSVLGFV